MKQKKSLKKMGRAHRKNTKKPATEGDTPTRARATGASKQQTRTIMAKVKFLRDFAVCGVVGRSARAAGVGRQVIYSWLKDDPRFKELFDQAAEDALDTMEEEARRRGVDGVLEPVFQGGEKVGSIRKYSDTLLAMFLKGKRRENFSERQEITGARGGAVPVHVSYAAEMNPPPTPAELAELAEKARKG